MTLQPKNSQSALAQYAERIKDIDDEEQNIAYGGVLPRLHVAGGGALMLQDDAGETYKTLTGIVAVSRVSRAYWPNTFGSGEASAAPDCTSADGVVGVGLPGGDCATCKLNEWPTGGGRKECQEMRRLVVLTDEYGAFLLTIKPGSMRAWDRYAARLRSQGLRYFAVRTRFDLVTAQNRANVRFTRIQPTVAEALDAKTLAEVLAQYDQWAGLLTQQRTVAEDVIAEDAGDAESEV